MQLIHQYVRPETGEQVMIEMPGNCAELHVVIDGSFARAIALPGATRDARRAQALPRAIAHEEQDQFVGEG